MQISPIIDVLRRGGATDEGRKTASTQPVAPVHQVPATQRDIQNFRYREILLQGESAPAPFLAQQIAQARPENPSGNALQASLAYGMASLRADDRADANGSVWV